MCAETSADFENLEFEQVRIEDFVEPVDSSSNSENSPIQNFKIISDVIESAPADGQRAPAEMASLPQSEEIEITIGQDGAVEINRESYASPQEYQDSGLRIAEGKPERDELLDLLARKLRNPRGQPVSVVVAAAIDTTVQKVGNNVTREAIKMLLTYEHLRLKETKYQLGEVNLESLRHTLTRHQSHVLVLPIVSDELFSVYIYDRREPYYVFAYSEKIPKTVQFTVQPQASIHYARITMRRALYRYIHDLAYELPRSQAPPVVSADLPRWIASTEVVSEYNERVSSNFYATFSTGAILSKGENSATWWNSQVIGLNLGVRAIGNLYLEGGVEASAYNSLIGSVNYIFESQQTPIRFGLGLGAAYVTSRHVWTFDQTFGIGIDSYFAVASANVQFPIGGVYFKVEHRSFIGIQQREYMFTISPGLMVQF